MLKATVPVATQLRSNNLVFVGMMRESETVTPQAIYYTLLRQRKLSFTLIDCASSVSVVSWIFLETPALSGGLEAYKEESLDLIAY